MARAVSASRWRCAVAIAVALSACGASDEPAGSDPIRVDSGVDAGLRPVLDAATELDSAIAPPVAFVEPPLALPARTGEQQCQLSGTRANALPRLQVEPLLGELRFTQAHGIATRPGARELLFVFEQHGLLHRVDVQASPAVAQTVLDLSARVACCEGGGLRGVVLHPEYAQNGWVFVHYVTGGVVRRSRISRFTADPATDVVDAASERNLLDLQLPGQGREGGPLLFDREGMLLIALGDGGQDPPSTDARRPRGFAGAILRLDVTPLATGPSYAIPPDNPFADASDDTPKEVFAWGFRDPAHCDLDREIGELWCSDRGPSYSELDRVAAGRSHGWPTLDASLCAGTDRLCLDERYQAPHGGYRQFEGQCGIVGGHVHAAAEPALLTGVVLFADACSGTLFGAATRGPQLRKQGRAGAIAGGVRAVAGDGAGRVLAIDAEGRVLALTVAPDGVPGTFPELLSETGCYADLAAHRFATELIEYRLRSPLWSDGTHKRRFMRLPDGARIDAPASGAWEFPVGTLLVKQFALQFDDGDPESVRPIETRFMQHRSQGWEFHSYRWNEDATDAELVVDDGGADYDVVRGGEPTVQHYQFPGPQTCPACHAVAPGRVLGPRTDQLNVALAYQGEVEPRDQLALLSALDLFELPNAPLPALPDPADTTLPIEQRARSYLHANCAHCHQPGGWSSPDLTMDLRYELPLAEAEVCGKPPAFFMDGSALIAPGEPEQSAILIRMRDTGLERMPPVATTVVDPLGEQVLASWIESLSRCP
jgi:uncharacterized repeat protein (TIGR03806 family)